VEAAGARAGLERARIFELDGILDYKGAGQLGPGIELPLPIFDRRQGPRIRARAEVEQAGWAYVAVRRQVAAEVIDAHARLIRADAAVTAFRSGILPSRIEAVRLATLAFERGEESYLVVLEVTRARLDAQR